MAKATKIKPEKADLGWYVHIGYLTTEGLNVSMASKDKQGLSYFKTKEECEKAIVKYERSELRRLKRKYSPSK